MNREKKKRHKDGKGLTRKSVAAVIEESYKPPSPVRLEFGPSKKTYTMEENYRAYKLFSSLDVDHDGTISMKEVNSMLMGDCPSVFVIRFSHPDTGIIWGADSDGYISIKSFELKSPASSIPQLNVGLRLRRINSMDISSNISESRNLLSRLMQYIQSLPSSPLEMEFLEPLLVLTQSSNVLDLEVDNIKYSVTLPIGAVYELNDFKTTAQTCITQAYPFLSWLKVGIIKEKRQILFESDSSPFNLLFSTGPNYHRSCRFALGFGAIDYIGLQRYAGQPMTINLDLGLTNEQLTELTKELFIKFDKDASGELEFEEFRDFYVRFFDNGSSIEKLRKYARYKYSDKNHEAWFLQKLEEKKERVSRKKISNKINENILQEQRRKFLQNSELCSDGIYRRKKLVPSSIPPIIKETLESNNKSETTISNQLGQSSHAVELNIESGVDIGKPDSVDEGNNQDLGLDENQEKNDVDDEASVSVLGDGAPDDIAELIQDPHARKKFIVRKQALARKRRANRLVQVNRANAKLAVLKKAPREHLTELQIALRMRAQDALRLSKDEGVSSLVIDFSPLVCNPGLKIDQRLIAAAMGTASDAISIHSAQIERINYNPLLDVDLESVPNYKSNPATYGYFMVRDNLISPAFDSTTRHPAYFGADFIRGQARSGLNLCRYLEEDRHEGEAYRRANGLYRAHALPSEETYIPKKTVTWYVDQQRKKIEHLYERIVDTSLAGRITISTLTLSGLPSMHLFSPNSPFITLACYKQNDIDSTTQPTEYTFKASTEVCYRAGSHAAWDGLAWAIPMEWGSKININIFSAAKLGIQDATQVSSVSITAEKIINLPADRLGYATLKLPLECVEKKAEAFVTIHLTIEKGDSWEWFVAAYHKREREAAKLRRIAGSLPSKVMEDILYPVKVEISSLAILDFLPTRSTISAPRVRVQCGTWESLVDEPKEEKVGGRRAFVWEALAWRFDIGRKVTQLVIRLESGSERKGLLAIALGTGGAIEVARCSMSAEKLFDYPRDHNGYFQVYTPIKREGREVGHLSMRCCLISTNQPVRDRPQSSVFAEGSQDGDVDQPNSVLNNFSDTSSNFSEAVNTLTLTDLSVHGRSKEGSIYDDDLTVSVYDKDKDKTILTAENLKYHCLNPNDEVVPPNILLSTTLHVYLHTVLISPENQSNEATDGFAKGVVDQLFSHLDTEAPIMRLAYINNDEGIVVKRELKQFHSHHDKKPKNNIAHKSTWTCEISEIADISLLSDIVLQVCWNGAQLAGCNISSDEFISNCVRPCTRSRLSAMVNSESEIQISGRLLGPTFSASFSLYGRMLANPNSAESILVPIPQPDFHIPVTILATENQPREPTPAKQESLIDIKDKVKSSDMYLPIMAKEVNNRDGRAGALINNAIIPFMSKAGNNEENSAIEEIQSNQGSLESQIQDNVYPFNLVIREVSVIDLPSGHLFKRNSPRVSIAIGKITKHSLPQADGGQAACFSGLDWQFTVTSVNQFVHLSISSDNVGLGETSLSPDVLLDVPKDSRGVGEIFLELIRGKSASGRLKLVYTIDWQCASLLLQSNKDSSSLVSNIRNDIDKSSIEGFRNSEIEIYDSIVQQNQTINNIPSYELSAVPMNDDRRVMPLDERRNIDNPLIVTIYSVIAFDLPSVHRFARNAPFLKATCGPWTQTSNIGKTSNELSRIVSRGRYEKWVDLGWSVILDESDVDEDNNPSIWPYELCLSVMSQSIVIGSVVLTPSLLLSSPTDSLGNTEIDASLVLIDEDKITLSETRGTVRILCRVDPYTVSDETGLSPEAQSPKHAISSTPTELPFYTDLSTALTADWIIRFKSAIFKDGPSINMSDEDYFDDSTYLLFEYRDYTATTPALKYTPNSGKLGAVWPHLILPDMNLKALSPSFRVMAGFTSGESMIGGVALTLTDVLENRDVIRYRQDRPGNTLGPEDLIIECTLSRTITQYGIVVGQLILGIEASPYIESSNNQISQSEDKDVDDGISLTSKSIELPSNQKSTVKIKQDPQIPIEKLPVEPVPLKSAMKTPTSNLVEKSQFNGKLIIPMSSENSSLATSKSLNVNSEQIVSREDSVLTDDRMGDFSYEYDNDGRRESLSSLATSAVMVAQQLSMEDSTLPRDIGQILASPRVQQHIKIVEKMNTSSDYVSKPKQYEPMYIQNRNMSIEPSLSSDASLSYESLIGDSIGGEDVVIIRHITCWGLASVHKAGKNSPLVTIESDRWKKRSKAISFGGNRGTWENVNWPLPLERMSPLNISISSGLVLIGRKKVDINTFIKFPSLKSSNIDDDGNCFIEFPLYSDISSSHFRSLSSSALSKTSVGSAENEIVGYIRLDLNYGPQIQLFNDITNESIAQNISVSDLAESSASSFEVNPISRQLSNQDSMVESNLPPQIIEENNDVNIVNPTEVQVHEYCDDEDAFDGESISFLLSSPIRRKVEGFNSLDIISPSNLNRGSFGGNSMASLLSDISYEHVSDDGSVDSFTSKRKRKTLTSPHNKIPKLSSLSSPKAALVSALKSPLSARSNLSRKVSFANSLIETSDSNLIAKPVSPNKSSLPVQTSSRSISSSFDSSFSDISEEYNSSRSYYSDMTSSSYTSALSALNTERDLEFEPTKNKVDNNLIQRLQPESSIIEEQKITYYDDCVLVEEVNSTNESSQHAWDQEEDKYISQQVRTNDFAKKIVVDWLIETVEKVSGTNISSATDVGQSSVSDISDISSIEHITKSHDFYMRYGNSLTRDEIIHEMSVLKAAEYIWCGCQLILRQEEMSALNSTSDKDSSLKVNMNRRQAIIAKHETVQYDIKHQKDRFEIPLKFRSMIEGLDPNSEEDLLQQRWILQRKHWEANQRLSGNHSMIIEEVIKGSYIPYRVKLLIQSIEGINLTDGIAPALMPRKPYITACKPYGNWSAETSVQTSTSLSWNDLPNKFHWEPLTIKHDESVVFDIRDRVAGDLIAAKCKLLFPDIFTPLDYVNDISVTEKLKHGIAVEGISGSNVDKSGQIIIPARFFVTKEYIDVSEGLVHPRMKTDVIIGRIVASIDFSVDIFDRPHRDADYWSTRRIQHWCTYPVAPISSGLVRQKYLEISQEYDKQMIINPVFFGFKVRWRGRDEDESRFTHPIFSGYSLNRRQELFTPKKVVNSQVASANLAVSVKLKLLRSMLHNNFVYDPYEKSQGRCPVCREGIDGCPRCFMIPTVNTDTKQVVTRDQFGFDPIRSNRREFLDKQKRFRDAITKIKNSRENKSAEEILKADNQLKEFEKMSILSMIDDNRSVDSMVSSLISDDLMNGEISEDQEENDLAVTPIIEKKLKLHTNLTTFSSIRMYRNMVAELVTIYVKVMPTGSISKVIIDPTKDSVFHLYHAFHSHFAMVGAPTAVGRVPMMILPTARGYFELTNSMDSGSKVMLPDFCGRMMLSKYGIHGHRQKIVLLYFASYQPTNVRSMISSYLEHNIKGVSNIQNDSLTRHVLNMKELGIHTHASLTNKEISHESHNVNLQDLPILQTLVTLKTSPLNLAEDTIQKSLLSIARVQYTRQQKEISESYVELGKEHWNAVSATTLQLANAHQAAKDNIEFAYQEAKKRIQSQVKSLGHRKQSMDQFIGIQTYQPISEAEALKQRQRQLQYEHAALAKERKKREIRLMRLEGYDIPSEVSSEASDPYITNAAVNMNSSYDDESESRSDISLSEVDFYDNSDLDVSVSTESINRHSDVEGNETPSNQSKSPSSRKHGLFSTVSHKYVGDIGLPIKRLTEDNVRDIPMIGPADKLSKFTSSPYNQRHSHLDSGSGKYLHNSYSMKSIGEYLRDNSVSNPSRVSKSSRNSESSVESDSSSISSRNVSLPKIIETKIQTTKLDTFALDTNQIMKPPKIFSHYIPTDLSSESSNSSRGASSDRSMTFQPIEYRNFALKTPLPVKFNLESMSDDSKSEISTFSDSSNINNIGPASKGPVGQFKTETFHIQDLAQSVSSIPTSRSSASSYLSSGSEISSVLSESTTSTTTTTIKPPQPKYKIESFQLNSIPTAPIHTARSSTSSLPSSGSEKSPVEPLRDVKTPRPEYKLERFQLNMMPSTALRNRPPLASYRSDISSIHSGSTTPSGSKKTPIAIESNSRRLWQRYNMNTSDKLLSNRPTALQALESESSLYSNRSYASQSSRTSSYLSSESDSNDSESRYSLNDASSKSSDSLWDVSLDSNEAYSDISSEKSVSQINSSKNVKDSFFNYSVSEGSGKSSSDIADEIESIYGSSRSSSSFSSASVHDTSYKRK